MKINKKVKIAAGSILGIAFLLFATLIVHVAYMVKKEAKEPFAHVQMSRTDFQQPVDSASALAIQNKIKTLKGVKSTYFNLKDNILIYTFDNRENTAQDIYNNAIKNTGFASSRHIVSSKEMNTGCPVMNPNSFYGKLSTLVAKVVN
ncbi:hypothetical protein [Arachidicoccus sp.]|uniref:hypothetical protein n=1 Tax=Arachidicoccus sp. TaxID=1872624 RepID=UPI003D1956D0